MTILTPLHRLKALRPVCRSLDDLSYFVLHWKEQCNVQTFFVECIDFHWKYDNMLGNQWMWQIDWTTCSAHSHDDDDDDDGFIESVYLIYGRQIDHIALYIELNISRLFLTHHSIVVMYAQPLCHSCPFVHFQDGWRRLMTTTGTRPSTSWTTWWWNSTRTAAGKWSGPRSHTSPSGGTTSTTRRETLSRGSLSVCLCHSSFKVILKSIWAANHLWFMLLFCWYSLAAVNVESNSSVDLQ